MKASLTWLRDYAPLEASVAELAQHLVQTGTEVERVERGPEGVVVARILSLRPVPESRRGVVFADIDAGAQGSRRILTGAPNLHVGDLVPWAAPGTRLPGQQEAIGVRPMFGGKYESPGMLCSAAELGVGDDADGILVLDRGTPGQPLHEVLSLETVFELEVTPNRPDCLSHVGIARELAASLREPLHEPPADVPDDLLSAASAKGRVSVAVEDPTGCPRFCVRLIENVVVKPSPPWMQQRLKAIGVRPINNVVDVTNFVAWELGQPLHAFDLARFIEASRDGQKSSRVVVRRARPGERVMCLDDVERELTPSDMAVCAGEQAVSIAGVIGGSMTAVDEMTRGVLLEAASWDGSTIRATSRRLGVRTDASSLFEKGLSDELPAIALERAAALIAELGQGHVLRDVVEERSRRLPPPPPIDLTGRFMSDLLGYHVDASEAATVLARLGFAVEQEGDELRVTAPHFRRDVTIREDVVEEVSRSLGYSRLPSTLPGRRSLIRALAPDIDLDERVRDGLVGAGFDEVITYSFTSSGLLRSLPGSGAGRKPLLLRNPLKEDDWQAMRTTLLPGVCQAIAANAHQGMTTMRVFEVGRAFWQEERRGQPPGALADGVDDQLPPLPCEPLLLALASFSSDTGAETGARGLRDEQSLLQWVAHDLAGSELTVV
ncbi:MAG TPA: phenylalanine--tRNA ligase subunit beta, partial [Candidatus Sulfotelmatobacter sp.]|nr:phenylalanine--tRNA ligase subunit beta [Candidatus Sulfotelmatobacter sp.]